MWSVSKETHFLDLDSLAGCEWSASRPSRYTPGIGGHCHLLFRKSSGGPQSVSGLCGEEKVFDPRGTRTRPLGRPRRS
jgi:hypothetical protein